MRKRYPDEQRALGPEQRKELLRLVAAVPREATPDHPAVHALVAYHRSLHVPWWASGSAYLRLGGMCSDGRTNIAVGLAEMRRLAECDDWGDVPEGNY
jgi:hypothetical protein